MIALGVVAVTVVGMGLLSARRTRSWLRALVRSRPVRWLPEAVAALTVLALIGFAARPYFQTVRGETDPATISYVAELQKLAHVPIDPTRQYAEDSLYWVIWYIGVPAVILGAIGIALLSRRCLRALLTWRDNGAARIWALPLMIIGWVTVTVLWRPGIIPDQPWASRRLVPVVLPGLILAAVWASAWIKERGRLLGASHLAGSVVAVCCVLALLIPGAVTTFGVGTTKSEVGSTRLTAHGLALKRTGAGEEKAVRELCGNIGPNASVIIVDSLTADRFSQVIRSMCATPTARMDSPTAASVAAVVAGIERAGRRPMLLAGQQSQLAAYGGSAQRGAQPADHPGRPPTDLATEQNMADSLRYLDVRAGQPDRRGRGRPGSGVFSPGVSTPQEPGPFGWPEHGRPEPEAPANGRHAPPDGTVPLDSLLPPGEPLASEAPYPGEQSYPDPPYPPGTGLYPRASSRTIPGDGSRIPARSRIPGEQRAIPVRVSSRAIPVRASQPRYPGPRASSRAIRARRYPGRAGAIRQGRRAGYSGGRPTPTAPDRRLASSREGPTMRPRRRMTRRPHTVRPGRTTQPPRTAPRPRTAPSRPTTPRPPRGRSGTSLPTRPQSPFAPLPSREPEPPPKPELHYRGAPPDGRAPHVSIVLPCYNEQDHVLLELERISRAMDISGLPYELIAVDDASTDGTLERLRSAEPKLPRLRVVHFPRNGGAGTVRQIGTQQAKGEIVVWTDADMTYPNERIPELVAMLDADPAIDQVVGARTSEEGTHKVARVPAKWFIRKLAEKLTNSEIPDLNSGLRAFRREVAQPYLRLLPPGFSCVTTITLAFLSNQHAVAYVPIDYAKRAGVSKFRFFSDAYRYILQVLRMVMYFNPLKVLMPVALFLLALGLLKGVYDMVVHPFYFAINTVLIFVTGLIIASLGPARRPDREIPRRHVTSGYPHFVITRRNPPESRLASLRDPGPADGWEPCGSR